MPLTDFPKYPLWAMSLATGAKSFRDNRVIGSPALNRWGLHARRVELAHGLANLRRARLAHLVTAGDREGFDRDGFVLIPDFLPPSQFRALNDALVARDWPAREMAQGDTITRRMAIDGAALSAIPHLGELLGNWRWAGLLRYVASFAHEPLYYVQTILSHVRDAPPDPQTDLHADTFHPSMKAWYFLTDVAADAGPFTYVPGSHRLTPQRLAFEYAKSLQASRDDDRYSARGSFRIRPEELRELGLAAPRAFAVPANTLVVADTFGFHARGYSASPMRRLEIFAYSRRNPFTPWSGFDVAGAFGFAHRRVPALWALWDLTARAGLRGNPWRPAGVKKPLAEP